ncbi:MAG: hypothetical protein RI897_796 [Verrucomicrobiota bacterium]
MLVGEVDFDGGGVADPDGEEAEEDGAEDIADGGEPLAFLHQAEGLETEGGEGGVAATEAGEEEESGGIGDEPAAIGRGECGEEADGE